MKVTITCECGRTFSGHGKTSEAAESDAMFKKQAHACSGPKNQNGTSKQKGQR